jgi:hypothetical protein
VLLPSPLMAFASPALGQLPVLEVKTAAEFPST